MFDKIIPRLTFVCKTFVRSLFELSADPFDLKLIEADALPPKPVSSRTRKPKAKTANRFQPIRFELVRFANGLDYLVEVA